MHYLRQEESYMFLLLSNIVRKIQPGYLKVWSLSVNSVESEKKNLLCSVIEVDTIYSEE